MTEEIIEKFKEKFSVYEFPFQKANDKLIKMDDVQKMEYYRTAKEITESIVWKNEIEELIRTFYQELSLKTTTELQQNAYRLTLIAIQQLEQRFNNLAMLHKPPSGNAINKKIR